MRVDRIGNALSFDLILPEKGKAELVFQGAEDWRLNAFGVQNVLFGLQVWSAEVPDVAEACAELAIDAFWVERIVAGELTLYEVEPSVGLNGYVIARSVALTGV
ncbi:hypothetical protein D7X55_12295 [Corallococcus sp. AB049A]|uniref:Uncharacterized protein n=1 Tax=Corallococcus interemptor TaxID=2316720 RepID=A0A3A8QGM4_9BACT|nr:hypothetical protein D7Y23_09850 [Corallococcus sp. AB050B]RKH67843.1 hypothetical protein D7X96_18560 [Corallococcus interemptor]RKI68539.1 hypothetical protein D7X55_12295 [Corallococcus sp. AB049A]